jgi:hypothetical protein
MAKECENHVGIVVNEVRRRKYTIVNLAIKCDCFIDIFFMIPCN